MSSPFRFVGLTRDQWTGVLVLLVCLVLGTQTYLMLQTRDLAEQGSESHHALCANKASVARQVRDSEAFLRLSPAERVEKYGRALGAIPDATIRSGLVRQRAFLAALATLHCS